MRRISSGIRLAILTLFASVSLGPTAQALDSTVSALVCNATMDGGAIFITSPLNDSSIGSSVLTVKGTVSKISQVELYIDGAYSQTKALSPGTTTYSMQTTISKGTHTIFVRGSDNCGGNQQSSSVVVTYQPQVAPSVGSSVVTSGGVVVGGNSLDSETQPLDIPEQSGGTYFFPMMTDVFRMTDLDTLGNVSLAWAFVHIILLVVGLTLLVAGPNIYRWFVYKIVKSDYAIPSYLPRLTRFIGAGLALIAFIV